MVALAEKCGVARVGHVGRDVEDGLRLVVEVRGDDQFAGAVEAEARLDVVEAVGDGEGRGGEHDGVKAVKERLAQDGRDIDGRGLEKDVFGFGKLSASAAALDPIDGVFLAALHEEARAGRGVRRCGG